MLLDEPACGTGVPPVGCVYHYLHDALGSVIGLTDADGLLVERYTYDPYGRTTIERRNVESYAANGCTLIPDGDGAITPS